MTPGIGRQREHPRARAALSRAVAGGVIAACLAVVTAGARGAVSDSVARPRPPSIQDSPGWYPIVDPESMSVVLGRRTNAPVVSTPFRGGTASLDDLGRTICRLLARSDRDSLIALCIRDDEFRDILWREFPHSRPITGLTWEDGWTSLAQRLISGCSGAVGEYGGKRFEFLRFEVDSVGRYKNFKLHMRLRLIVRDDQGQAITMRWVRSVAERKGRYKIYSTDD